MTTTSYDPFANPKQADAERRVFEFIYGALIVATLVLFDSDYAFPGEFKWVPVSVAAAVTLLWAAARIFMREKVAPDVLDLSVLAFLAYAGLSLLWSPDPLNGWAFVIKTSLLAVIFLGVRNFASETFLRGVVIAVTFSSVVSLAFVVLDIGLFAGYFNHNFLTEYLLLTLPFVGGMFFLYRAWPVRALSVTIAILILVYLVGFNPSKIEFFVIPGTTVGILALLFWSRHKKQVLAIALGLVLAVSAVVAYRWESGIGMGHGFRSSIYSRIGLNAGAALMWKDAPLLGQGAGSFNALFPYYQEKYLDWVDDQQAAIFVSKETLAGAAHNEYLQFLGCFGLAGALIVAFFAFHLLRRVRQSPQPVIAYIGLATTLAWALNALLEFPLQNPATALLAALGLAFIAWQRPDLKPVRVMTVEHGTGLMLLLLALVVCGFQAYGTWRFDAAQRYYRNTLAFLNTAPDKAFADNMAAVRLFPLDTEMRVQSYVTATRWFELTKVAPLTPGDNDWLFNRAVKAGPTNMLLLARLQYLFNSGRLKERKKEADAWLEHLKKNATHTTDVWILETYFALAENDLNRAKTSIEHIEALPCNDYQKGVLATLKGAVAKAAAPVVSGTPAASTAARQ